MKWLNAVASCAAVLLLCGCGNFSLFDSGSAEAQGPVATGPAANITRTEGYVFLHNDAAYKQFVVPAVPAGAARLYGDLISTWPEASRNYTWKDESQKGDAWFYVDFDPATGGILDARAFARGYADMEEYLGFFEKYKGSFGSITKKGFELQIAGASGGDYYGQGSGRRWEAPAVIFIRGSADLLGKKNGARIPFTYEMVEIPGEAINISSHEILTGEIIGDEIPTETKIEKRTVTKDELVDKGEGTAVLTK